MRHARADYASIQDVTAAVKLARIVLDMGLITDKGTRAKDLAREVLGIAHAGGTAPITTNGTTRWIPADEPVFLIRGQDVAGGDAVRGWATKAETRGADKWIVEMARDHARKMDAWPKKKVPDLPRTRRGE